jgi:hypothetical protein
MLGVIFLGMIECYNAESIYAVCVDMLSVIMTRSVVLSVLTPSVVSLNVVAPSDEESKVLSHRRRQENKK